MSNTVAVALSAAANAQASAALNAARNAECRVILSQPAAPHGAAEMRAYSECIQRIYPDPASPAETMILKGSILLALVLLVLGVVGSVVFAFRTKDVGTGVLGSLIAPLVSLLIGFVVFAAAHGILYLLS